MDIQFKGKTYEKYFGHELARLTNITYSPDHTDEALLGFEEAFFVPKIWFFLLGPYVRQRRRNRFTSLRIDEFNKHGRIASEHIPAFRFNLFIQFRRPTFLKSRGAKQWSDWKQSFYRYGTNPHQQEALSQIDIQSAGRAIAIYASPAFWQTSDFWNHVQGQTIIENSNMVRAKKFNGHSFYSYAEPGFVGKGHTKTEDIICEPLPDLIQKGLEENNSLPLNQHLIKTAAAIIAATGSSEHVATEFNQVCAAMGMKDYDPESLFDAIGIIDAYCEAFALRHYAVG